LAITTSLSKENKNNSMKKLYTLIVAVLLTATTFAQAPEKMSYQAVVRDNGDALIKSLAVGMQISILQGSASGTAVYIETQTPTTNANGLVTLEIGAGTTTDDFTTIDWSAGPYFIKTEIDVDNNASYDITGTSQLLSVPYALHAETVTQPTYNVDTFYAALGGYVIETNADGTHGLVAAMQDQGYSNWYGTNDLLSNANNHDVNGAKFKDWRIPTKRELNLIYIKKGSIGGFANFYYWSSTEIDYYNTGSQYFNDGVLYSSDKLNNTNYARAVRAF
jgi:hypothetical protein